MYFVSCVEMRCFLVLLWICSPSRILGFGVQLEGLIDLGPNWGYKYKLSPLSTTELSMFSDSRKGRKDLELTHFDTRAVKYQNIRPPDILELEENKDSVNNISMATQIISNQTDKESKIYITKKSDVRSQTGQKFKQNADNKIKNKKKRKTHSDKKSNKSVKRTSNDEVKKDLTTNKNIKENDLKAIDVDKNFLEFVQSMYRHTLNIFKKFGDKISMAIKNKVEILTKFSEAKVLEFVNLFDKQKLRTKLGPQKLVLNTIETSNRILVRLVNSLSNYENSIKGGYSILRQEVEREKQLQYLYVCKKFGVCRTSNDFGDYLIEFINIILQTDNGKIKQAADGLTEVVKASDFTQTIDLSTQEKLRKKMANIELWDALLVRSMFVILKNVLSHRNQPMVVMAPIDEQLSNKTVAFHEIIDTLNKNIYKSDNTTVFIKIKKQLEEWRDGSRNDVQKIFHSLIELIKKGLDKIDRKAAEEINKNMNIILKPIFSKTFEI